MERTISDYAQFLNNKKVKFNPESYDEYSKQFEKQILNKKEVSLSLTNTFTAACILLI